MSLDGLKVFERGTFPRWVKIRQTLETTEIADVAAAVAEQFAKPEIAKTITPGARVAITAGSRGVDKIARVIKATVSEVKRLGGEPFVIPAMGSHAGATAEGQTELISHYGITEAEIGAPIRASMETVLLGEVHHDGDEVPVYFDKIAYEQADLVIPVGRIKPHTDFHGPIESGIMKMIAIGLGKQKGADTFHWRGFPVFHTLIPAVGLFSLSRVNIPFAIGLVENGYSHLGLIEAIPNRQILDREKELLRIAREWLGRLPGEELDILIVDKIGKDISGDGADPNVINRDATGLLATGEVVFKPAIQRVIFRDLTKDTDGNATGLGMADVVLKRLVDKIDRVSTYMNLITAKSPGGAKIPMTVDNDREALYIALASALRTEVETARIARIESTKNVEELWVSEAYLPQALASGRVEVIGELQPIAFDEQGLFAD
jgi:hypothetical protein